MSKPFTPRTYQRPMIDHVLDLERCSLWAGLGTGKTVATLSAIDILQLSGMTKPALVLAPLRVAKHTWSNETGKWDHLSGMDVKPIVGTPAERKAALRAVLAGGAGVAACNYDNIPWLLEELDGKWPFGMIVADESTRLKSFRGGFRTHPTSGKVYYQGGGGTRARALGRVAHQTERFVNLTGTPASNGLADLWGQQWFIDAGKRLGRSHDAFMQRWFAKGHNGFGYEPHAFAEEQIHAALADVCQTVDIRDYYDIGEPVVNIVEVELPAKARALYRSMEKKMFMDLAGHEVEAVHAAARTIKCLAEGSLVLTQRGWTPIEDCAGTDLFWDGEEWVSACKLVDQGVHEVIDCDGVWSTPDHRFLTKSGWAEAQEIGSGEPAKGYDWPDVRLPYSSAPRGLDQAEEQHNSAGNLALPMRMRGGGGGRRREPSQPEQGPEEVVRMPPPRDADRRLGVARHDRNARLGDVAEYEVSLHQPERQGLAQLRRAGGYGLHTLAGELRELLGGYGADLRSGPDHRADRQQRGLQPRELQVGDADRASQQPKTARGMVARTFDIVNCGPRQRFVVLSNSGPIISHNCLQIANGAAFVDEDSTAWEEIHDAKLQALESIVEEANGAPVLVAYHFKPDLVRLKRAFKHGIDLSTDEGLARAMKGEGRVWFAHPMSLGHGVDGLQEHCNIIAFFGHWWSLENHDQIIERVGPTRQMQAGKERPVYVHYIIAVDTVDEMVRERQVTKRSTQDILLEAMKRKNLI